MKTNQTIINQVKINCARVNVVGDQTVTVTQPPEQNITDALLMEDGCLFLMEDGSYFRLESAEVAAETK